MATDLTSALDELKRGGFRVPPAAEAAVRRQLVQFADALDEKTKRQLLQKFLDGLQSIARPVQTLRLGETRTVTEGATPASLTSDINKLLLRFENGAALVAELNLGFKLDVANKVMRGAGHFLTDQTDVDEYPAWELHRIYDRDLPRGEKRGPKGAIIEVPDEAWDTEDGRWVKACADAGDDEALRVFNETGRMVALKSSGVWAALGAGAGGYDDTLGNPFAPFAFNSGYGTDGVPRLEAIELGLLATDERAKPADYDFKQLFTIPEAA